GRPDSRPRLHEINCPTLVHCGREDPITPPEVHAEIAQAIPGSNLVILDDCSHLTPLEQPEQVTHELRSWLTEIQSAYAMRSPRAASDGAGPHHGAVSAPIGQQCFPNAPDIKAEFSK